MATITPTPLPTVKNGLSDTSRGVLKALTPTTLTASDTFAYIRGTGQILILRNPTGGTITPVIDGDGGVSWPVDAYGRQPVSAGLSVALTAGQVKAIPLDSIEAYLQGTIAITGGTGVIAFLINPIL